MADEQSEQAAEPVSIRIADDTLFPLRLVNRVITTLQLIVVPPVLLVVILTLVYFLSLLVSPSESSGREEFRSQLSLLLQQFSPAAGRFATEIWSFLAPILSLVVIVVILKWLLFSSKDSALREGVGSMVRDVPSLIAIIVLVTLCLLPVVRVDVPQPLSNIALVIVGFYFGVERRVVTPAGRRAAIPTDEKGSS